MKQNKWGLLFSAIFSAISLTGYLCSKLICFNGNSILADISVAIFSSSVFVVILSTIGYLVEKKRQRNLILDTCFVDWINSGLMVIDENNTINKNGILIILADLEKGLAILKNNLSDYYSGLIIKDKDLKQLYNSNLFNFYKDINEFITYLNSCECKNEIVNIRFEKIISDQESLSDAIIVWMKNRKFELGKEFDFGENFVADYEKATLELNKE